MSRDFAAEDAQRRRIQRLVGVIDDGDFGPLTLHALERELMRLKAVDDAAAEEDTQRIGLPRWTFGGEPLRKGVHRDPSELLPGFADKVEALFRRLRDRGLQPLLWEAYRTPERADELAKRGTGASGKRSMHCLGAAVDIVHATQHWNAPQSFWEAIGEEAAALGLTWGGRWSRPDKPHVQAVPVLEQAAFRKMSERERAQRVV